MEEHLLLIRDIFAGESVCVFVCLHRTFGRFASIAVG